MDILDVYFAFFNLKQAAIKVDPLVFNKCIKYRLISQIGFTLFATFAGFSASFMSVGLLISYEFFSDKAIYTFINMNYLIFGPYLFTVSLLGLVNFNDVAYDCDGENYHKRNLNLSTVVAMFICFLLSGLVTVIYAVVGAMLKMTNSIRFNSEGNAFIGRIFWRLALNRERSASEYMSSQSHSNGNSNSDNTGNTGEGSEINGSPTNPRMMELMNMNMENNGIGIGNGNLPNS